MRSTRWNTVNALKYGGFFGILSFVLRHLPRDGLILDGLVSTIAEMLGAVLGGALLFKLAAVVRNLFVKQDPVVLDLSNVTKQERLEPYIGPALVSGTSAESPVDADATEPVPDRKMEPETPKVSGWKIWRYVSNHWRGQLSLAKSYWINGVLLGAVLGAAAGAYSASLSDDPSATQSVLALTFFILAGVLFPVWSLVGTWRASTRDSRENKRVWLPGLAKLAVIVGFISVLTSWGKVSVYFLDVIKMYRGDSDMAYTLQLDNNELTLQGFITIKSADEILNYLKYNPNIQMLDLASAGGRIAAAMAIAAEVNRGQLNTYARGDCLSACTIVFLSGKNRMIFTGARLGFHQVSEAGFDQSEIAEQQARMRQYYLQRGIPPWFVDKAMSVSPSEMWYPTLDELTKAGIITHLFDNKTIQEVH